MRCIVLAAEGLGKHIFGFKNDLDKLFCDYKSRINLYMTNPNTASHFTQNLHLEMYNIVMMSKIMPFHTQSIKKKKKKKIN